MMQLEINDNQVVFLDSAPIIYYIEDHPEYAPLMEEVMRSFQEKRIILMTSVISLTEVLIKPLQSNRIDLALTFKRFLKKTPNLFLIHIDDEISEEAAAIRAQYSFIRTMDAFQLATAVVKRASVFLTNDRKLRQVQRIPVIILNDYLDMS